MLGWGSTGNDGTESEKKKALVCDLYREKNNGNSLPFPSLEQIHDSKTRECLELCLLFEEKLRKTNVFVIKM